MAIKNLVVMLDGGVGCAARIDAALVMVEKYQAHLTGVYARPKNSFVPENLEYLLPADTHAELKKVLHQGTENEAQAVHQLFNEKIAAAGVADRAHWHTLTHDPDKAATLIARYADLVIAGQYIDGKADIAAIDPREVVFSSGRPLLIFPQSYQQTKPLTGHAVIGWNRSREASRALADAMQILETKSKVTVVVVDRKSNPQGELPFDVIEHIRRHGINAEKVELPLSTKNPGLEIMHYAEKVEADLLVMGAYSRSRWQEQLMGGATCSIMREMTVPVLMSH